VLRELLGDDFFDDVNHVIEGKLVADADLTPSSGSPRWKSCTSTALRSPTKVCCSSKGYGDSMGFFWLCLLGFVGGFLLFFFFFFVFAFFGLFLFCFWVFFWFFWCLVLERPE